MGTENKKKKNVTNDNSKSIVSETTNSTKDSENNNEYNMMNEICKSLEKQVKSELHEEEPEQDIIPKKKKFPRWAKVLTSIFCVLLCLAIIFLGTPWGRQKLKKAMIYIATEYAYSKMEINNGSNAVIQDPVEDVETTKEEENKPLEIMWGNSGYDGSGRHEQDVINILLLGEEAIGSGTSRGRTDMMMIATLNVKEKTVKLTSIMRDTLVQIPDYEGKSYRDNKLNSAYEIGGIKFLYETIVRNFDIALDGYALVGFENFEKVIDAIGGVEVTLSEKEARYLNSTNYISKRSNRNVVPGTQTLNGNQALGFCRVRHVPTIDDQHYDYGRTSRQRVVLNAIFDKCKKMSITKLIMMMNELLEYVTTDITKEQFRNYLEIGLSLDISHMENCRIPADGTYTEGYERGMAVLIPDLDANIKVLHSFIFGDQLEEGMTDGTILDGMDRINAKEKEKQEKEAEEQNNQTTNGQ